MRPHAAHLRSSRHQHGGVEDAVLLGADQVLAVQQQVRPVGAVRHLEERDAAGLAHLGDAGAVSFAPHPTLSPAGRGWDEILQREPIGVVEVGGEERDDGEGTVGHGLAGQEGGEELGDLGDFARSSVLAMRLFASAEATSDSAIQVTRPGSRSLSRTTRR